MYSAVGSHFGHPLQYCHITHGVHMISISKIEFVQNCWIIMELGWVDFIQSVGLAVRVSRPIRIYLFHYEVCNRILKYCSNLYCHPFLIVIFWNQLVQISSMIQLGSVHLILRIIKVLRTVLLHSELNCVQRNGWAWN